MTKQEKPRRRGRRVALWATLVVALLLGAGVVVLRTRFHGPSLARTIANTLNASMRGRIEIGTVTWPTSSLIEAIRGGFIPLTIENLRVFDDRGVLVLETPRVEARLHAHSLMFGDHIFVVEDIVVPSGAYVRLEQVPEPYPLHQYDTSVVSIISAFYARLEPQFRAGIGAYKGTVFDLRSYDIRDATIDFVYPSFTATLDHVSGKGFLYSDARDPLSLKLYYSLRPTAPTGVIHVGAAEVSLLDINVRRLQQLPTSWPREPIAQNVEWDLQSNTTDGTNISVAGGIYDFWDDVFYGDFKVAASAKNAGPMVERLSDGLAHGDHLDIGLDISGPFINPTMRVRISGVELAIPISEGNPPLPLTIDRATAVFDTATEEGYVEDTVARGAEGAVSLAATFGLAPYAFDASVEIIEPLQFGAYLPPQVARLLGTSLSGKIHAFGDGDVQEIDNLDLSLGRSRLTGNLVREKGSAIHAKRLTFTLGRSSLTSRGVFDVVDQTIDMRVSLDSTDLGVWLARAGVPALATRASGSGIVRGQVADPTATLDLSFGGVPILGSAAASIRYADGILAVPRIGGSPLGGTLEGEAKVDLNGKRAVIDLLKLDGRSLDLSKLPGYGFFFGGKATVAVDARGRTDRLDAVARVSVADATISGEAYSELAATATLVSSGDATLVTRAERTEGGRLDAEVSVDRNSTLAGVISLRELPIESLIPNQETSDSPLGGIVSAELQLSGSTAKPTVEGNVSVVQSWLAAAFLGAADLDIERVADGLLFVRGSLLQGRIRFDGTIATVAPFEVDLIVALQRVEIDQFLPAEALAFGTRAWVSGEMQIKTAILPPRGYRPEISVRLTETVVLVDSTDAQGRTLPIRLRNKAPITLAFDGVKAQLMEPALFESPTGDITVMGGGTAESIDLQVRGALTASLARPYLREYFDDIQGRIDLDVKVAGPVSAPSITATLDVTKLTIRPAGQDAVVTVEGGRIQLTNTQIALTGFNVEVTDPFTGERARLTIAGGIKLKDWAPALWAVRIDGQLAGKMLLVVAPRAFSQAGGLAEISVSLLGAGETPSIDGTISFDSTSPLALIPRGFRRELMFTSGQVSFTDQLIEIDDVGGRVDEDGRFRNMRGELSLENWEPVDIDLTLSADAIPFRVPQTLDLTLNLDRVRVVGGGRVGLDVSGIIELVDGRYIRNFQVDEFFSSSGGGASSRPFYEDIPLLANANLDLTLDARAFYVKNNIANAEFSGRVKIGGTPALPRLGGQIAVNQGDFRIPGMRARFTRSRGGATFSPLQRFPDDTPLLDITSEADFRDRNGQDHLITLTISGSLQSLKWDLYTSTGLSKSQTIAMLLSGRTPEEFRKSLGDEAPGSKDPTRFDTSTSSSDNFYDQVVRDLAGDFISKLLEDTLKNFTKLDVARLEIGAGSVAFHGEERVFKNLRFLGDFERSLRGQTWNVRGQLRLSDELSVEGEIVNKTFDDESEQDVDDKRLRLVYRRFFFP